MWLICQSLFKDTFNSSDKRYYTLIYLPWTNCYKHCGAQLHQDGKHWIQSSHWGQPSVPKTQITEMRQTVSNTITLGFNAILTSGCIIHWIIIFFLYKCWIRLTYSLTIVREFFWIFCMLTLATVKLIISTKIRQEQIINWQPFMHLVYPEENLVSSHLIRIK